MKGQVIDSSCWIEVFGGGPLVKKCLKEIETAKFIIVPSLVIFEVYRKIKVSISDESGLSATSYLSQFQIQPMNREVALLAADLSVQYKLATADSIILAHAHESQADLITLDNDFRGLPNVKVIS